MDWVSRFLGLPASPKKPVQRAAVDDPEARLGRFRRTYNTVLALCNRPRNLPSEGPLLEQLQACLERLVVCIREEAHAPAPHLCLQFSTANHVYALVGRAATVSQHEGVVHAAVGIFAALVDSDEEDLLASGPFAKSLMRLVTRAVDVGTNVETETAILELLFTISAKIRLQPEILGVWFQHRAKSPREDGITKEKERPTFVGLAQKDDFPLCYLFIDRVHHEGRIGDFARTGLLYIFEATGRSRELESWILSSDLPTLMASGLGALYSQLSRELSILHPDATLPAVLAMSDYTTTHSRATAESAFSDRHASHMAIFLSYLAFWQDVLDHCRSDDVKATLLDHFQILFLQQLLYPSLLQSSDTDAGSSVAVLTYLTAMLESLDYPDLMHMMLAYLLAIPEDDRDQGQPMPTSPVRTPRSPKAMRRRQSLMLTNAPNNPDEAVEPTLFNLVDLILNNVSSSNSQAAFASLKLVSTILTRQKKFAMGTLLKVELPEDGGTRRAIGAANAEAEKLAGLASLYHGHAGLDHAYAGLCSDVRLALEVQLAPKRSRSSASSEKEAQAELESGRHVISAADPLLERLRELLQTFWTNSTDVNLALTQAFVSIALCTDIRLDEWLALDPSAYVFADETSKHSRPWQAYLSDEEASALSLVRNASRKPIWPSDDAAPAIYRVFKDLAAQLDTIRATVPTLDALITTRKLMLQATGASVVPLTAGDDGPPSIVGSPPKSPFLDAASPRPMSSGRADSLPGSPRPGSRLGTSPNRLVRRTASPAISTALFQPHPPEAPTTTDILMQTISFPPGGGSGRDVNGADEGRDALGTRTASLNHVLTNVVVLQEFVLELAAVCQVRAAVLGEREVRFVV